MAGPVCFLPVPGQRRPAPAHGAWVCR